MSEPDIFLSYAHEDAEWVRFLVEALENCGWSVFWDRRIPTGKTWHNYIGQVLSKASCVVVVWSEHSIQSRWVLAEAEEARSRDVLAPVLISIVEPPLGFRDLHAADLSGWTPGQSSPELTGFLSDIRGLLDPSTSSNSKREIAPPTFPKRKFVRRTSIVMAGGMLLAAIVFLIFIVSPLPIKWQSQWFDTLGSDVVTQQKVHAQIYTHEVGLTEEDGREIEALLERKGISTNVSRHRDPSAPDAVFIGALVTADLARLALSSVPYSIRYIFPPSYPAREGGDPDGFLIGLGYMSTHYKQLGGPESVPVEVSTVELDRLLEHGITNVEFQKRLSQIFVPTIE